jgi:outer membrane protein TolC
MHKFLIITLAALSTLQALNMDESVALGLKNATKLKEVALNQELINVNKKSKEASQFGAFELVGSYDSYNLPRTLAPLTPSSITPNIATTQNLFSGGVKYSVALFTGFAQTKSIEIENIQQSSADIFEKLTQEQLVYNIKNIYLSLLSLQKQQEALDAYIKAQEQFLATVHDAVLLGKKAFIDELKAQSDLQESLSKRENLISSTEILKESLRYIIDKDVGVLEDISIEVVKQEFDLESLNLLDRMKALDLSLQIIDKKIGMKNSYKYPQISFDAYYGQNFGFNDAANPNEGDFNTQELWQFGVKIKYSLYDFGVNAYDSEALELQKLQNQAQNEGLKRELYRDVHIGLSGLNKTIADYKNSVTKYELLDTSAEIEKVRYDNGLVSINDLLFVNAQKELAKASMIDAKYSYQKALYYIEYILEKGVKQ